MSSRSSTPGSSDFPQRLIHVVANDAVDVLGVLHGARDMPSTLAGPQPD
ncbi:MAG: hypothetical protein ABIN08_06625 [Caldimonas sp.]